MLMLLVLMLAAEQAAPPSQAPSEANELNGVYQWTGSLPLDEGLPAYPDQAVAAGLEGSVEVEVVVSTTGRTLHRRLPRPQGNVLERAAVVAMSRWRFPPFRDVGGRITPVLLLVRFDFRLPPTGPHVTARITGVPPTPASLTDDGAPWPPPPPPDRRPTPPTVIRRVRAAYSEDAIRAKISGAVHLEIQILPDGTVGRSRVVKPLDPSLDRQARIAVGHWLFTPATLDGAPVATTAAMVIDFNLR
jgi:TonB family protein